MFIKALFNSQVAHCRNSTTEKQQRTIDRTHMKQTQANQTKNYLNS